MRKDRKDGGKDRTENAAKTMNESRQGRVITLSQRSAKALADAAGDEPAKAVARFYDISCGGRGDGYEATDAGTPDSEGKRTFTLNMRQGKTEPAPTPEEMHKARAARIDKAALKAVEKITTYKDIRPKLLAMEAEICGTTAAELIAGILKAKHGLADNPTETELKKRELDDYVDDGQTSRVLQYWMNDEAHLVGMTLTTAPYQLTDDEACEFVRRFYRLGDHSLGAAETRAFRAALKQDGTAQD